MWADADDWEDYSTSKKEKKEISFQDALCESVVLCNGSIDKTKALLNFQIISDTKKKEKRQVTKDWKVVRGGKTKIIEKNKYGLFGKTCGDVIDDDNCCCCF